MSFRSFSAFSPSIPLLLALCLSTACAVSFGEPTGTRFEVEKRFVRPIDAQRLGLRVRDDRAAGALSQEQVSRLSHFLAKAIRDSGSVGSVIDLTQTEAEMGGRDMFVDVGVIEFKAATKQERAEGKRSKLVGRVELSDRRGVNRGIAKVEVVGIGLELTGRSTPPDTARDFAEQILELIQQ